MRKQERERESKGEREIDNICDRQTERERDKHSEAKQTETKLPVGLKCAGTRAKDMCPGVSISMLLDLRRERVHARANIHMHACQKNCT